VNIYRAVFSALTLLTGAVLADDGTPLLWQANSVTYTMSNHFSEPGVERGVTKHIVEYVHANGYRYGNNLLRAKVMRSDDNDPRADGDGGATEFYLVYRHLLSLGAVTGRDFAFGPIRDVGLTLGIHLNSKDNAFGPRKRLLLAGPTFRFDVPKGAQLDLSLMAAKEYNECNLPPCLAPGNDSEIAFDTFPLVHLAFRFPFDVGGVGTLLEGFAAKGFRRGKDYVGNDVAYETLVRMAWMADVGRLVGERPNTLYAGVGYEYWRNKYGSSGLPGVDTNAPMLQVKWQF
jgi:nucleoside-specific outer membrane channel protein Tsx